MTNLQDQKDLPLDSIDEINGCVEKASAILTTAIAANFQQPMGGLNWQIRDLLERIEIGTRAVSTEYLDSSRLLGPSGAKPQFSV